MPSTLAIDLQHAAFDISTVLPWPRAVAIAPTLQSLAVAGTSHALLIGNSRQLWPHFVAAYRSDAAMHNQQHRFDQWIEQRLGPIVGDRPHRFGHRAYDGHFAPLQRLAVAAGLGRLSETHLVIHPVFGPWFSLRAVVAIDDAEAADFETSAAHAALLPSANQICDPSHCQQQCQQRFAEANAALPGSWQSWLAARAACCIGREWQFSQAQIAYHYAKDTTALDAPSAT